MTFEGFEAAPLIEAAGSTPAMADGASDAETLDAALREAARAERAATRAEGLVLDLWVRPGGGFKILDLPASGGTSAQAWAILADEPAPTVAAESVKDLPMRAALGEGEEEEEEIIVKGTKPKSVDDDSDWVVFWGGGDNGGDDIGGGSSIEPSETEQNDCRDRHAIDAKNEIRAHSDDGRREHGSLIYRGADSRVHHSSIIHGDADSIDQDDILEWMNANGVSMNQVIGFVHNHDAWWYATNDIEAAANRYPSVADWDGARWFVDQGAGGPDGSDFAMYVIDTAGRLREFEYEDRARYEGLSKDEKVAGESLPGETQSDGSSCG